MISASLAFHQPEAIYHFLNRNVGPLYMVVKAGNAIINFAKPEQASIALSKYHNATLMGMPLKLTTFREEDLKKQEQNGLTSTPNNEQVAVLQNPAEAKETSPALSEFTILL